jgi:gag-polypeptide of LTR copia-type
MARPTENRIDHSVRKFIDSASSFYLNSSDNPGMIISSCVLKGENYDMWVKAIKITSRANNKLGFVDCSLTKPTADEPEVSLWEISNSVTNLGSLILLILPSN